VFLPVDTISWDRDFFHFIFKVRMLWNLMYSSRE